MDAIFLRNAVTRCLACFDVPKMPGVGAAIIAATTVASLCLAIWTFWQLILGAPPAIAVEPRLTCAETCVLTPLRDGRFRAVLASGAELELSVPPNATGRMLMVRKGADSMATTLMVGGTEVALPDGTVSPVPRTLIEVNVPASGILTLTAFRPDTGPVVLEELGLYDRADALSTNDGSSGPKYKTVLPRVIAALTFLFLAGIVLAQGFPDIARLAALATVAISLAVSGAVCLVFYDPGTNRDLIAYAAQVAANGYSDNLGYGPYIGSNVLRGIGPMLGSESVPWNRMPGYAFVAAAGGLVMGSSDPLWVGVGTVLVQSGLQALAYGFLFLSLFRLMPDWRAFVIAVAAAFLPSQIYYTQADSMVPAAAAILAGMGCRYAATAGRGFPPLASHLLLHLGFASWFVFRPDVAPGWFAVSALLYLRRLHYMAIPALFYLSVGIPWALFKQPYLGVFSMTTTSVGHSAMGGLWEIPSPFIWEVSDGGVAQFLERNGYAYGTPAGDSFALHETFRFWATYPVYMAGLVWREFLTFVNQQSWPGFSFRELPVGSLRGNPTWLMLGILATSFAIGYRRLQTLVLGWSIPFNVTLFFLVFSSSGRFYNGAMVGALCATGLLVLDPKFWKQAWARWRRTGTVAILVAVAAMFGTHLDDALLGSSYRLAAPFLDPADSKLSVLREVTIEPDPATLPGWRTVPLMTATLANGKAGMEMTEGGELRIRTASTAWAYAVALPLPDPMAGLSQCTIAARLHIPAASVQMGVLTKDSTRWLANQEFAKDYSLPSDAYQVIRLPRILLAEAGTVVFGSGASGRRISFEVASVSYGDCQ